MICPYLIEVVKESVVGDVRVQPIEWVDADGVAQKEMTYFTPVRETTRAIPGRCVERGCAAWQDGCCAHK